MDAGGGAILGRPLGATEAGCKCLGAWKDALNVVVIQAKDLGYPLDVLLTDMEEEDVYKFQDAYS